MNPRTFATKLGQARKQAFDPAGEALPTGSPQPGAFAAAAGSGGTGDGILSSLGQAFGSAVGGLGSSGAAPPAPAPDPGAIGAGPSLGGPVPTPDMSPLPSTAAPTPAPVPVSAGGSAAPPSGMPIDITAPNPNMGMQHEPGGALSVLNQPGGMVPGAETQPSGLGTQRLFDRDARMATIAAQKAPKPAPKPMTPKPAAPAMPAPSPAAGLAKGASAVEFGKRLGKAATNLFPSMEGEDKRPDRPRLTPDKIKPHSSFGHDALKDAQRYTMRPDGKNLLKRR